MPTPGFLQALVELAACESIDALLARAVALLEDELAMRARIELWDDRELRARGDVIGTEIEWIGIEYTFGEIYLERTPPDRAPVELAATQLAPLVERLIDRELSRALTIREDVERLYDRRILEALARCGWNASAVARELRVSRNRVAKVARRWTNQQVSFQRADNRGDMRSCDR